MTSERKVNLYDRANHYRSINEFDKAFGIYEQIVAEDANDAEVYWSLVLCRYGVEYVEDPRTKKRIPTVNRTQYQSIYDDANYKAALQNASLEQKEVIEADAEVIDRIQKDILNISSKEQPYDIFICYKETDEQGRRTPDSVIAQDIYKELTKEGYKVFFSRISLEDKLGAAYEPYIFAALNSAKVMIAVGTKQEYFNAVWVKNEWSRYLGLINDGEKKVLIPAYKDMDPYDLPEEFSYLQAQDMSKLGFMQDLVRGVDKIFGSIGHESRNKGGFHESKRQVNWKKVGIAVCACLLIFAAVCIGAKIVLSETKKKSELNRVERLADSADFESAQAIIEQYSNIKDENTALATYVMAGTYYQQGKYSEALQLFESIPDYKDAKLYGLKCQYYSIEYDSNWDEMSFDDINDISEKLTELISNGVEDTENLQSLIECRKFEKNFETYYIARKYYICCTLVDKFKDTNYELAKEFVEKNKGSWYDEGMKQLNDSDLGYEVINNAKYLFALCGNYKDSEVLFKCLNIYTSNNPSSLWQYITDYPIASKLLWLEYYDWLYETSWESSNGKYYFKVSSDGHTSYNIPWYNDPNTYYSIDVDGIYYIYDAKDTTNPPVTRKNMFKFELISKNQMKVYCYKDGSEYMFYKQ